MTLPRASSARVAPRRARLVALAAAVAVLAALAPPVAPSAAAVPGTFTAIVDIEGVSARAGEARVGLVLPDQPLSTAVWASSAADGRATFSSVPGIGFQVVAEFLGDASRRIAPRWWSAGLYAVDRADAQLLGPNRTVSVSLRAAFDIAGRVALTSSSGPAPSLGDVEVTVRRTTSGSGSDFVAGDWSAPVTAGAGGEFAFSGIAPTVVLEIRVAYRGTGRFDSDTRVKLSRGGSVLTQSNVLAIVQPQKRVFGSVSLGTAGAAPPLGDVVIRGTGIPDIVPAADGSFEAYLDPESVYPVSVTYLGTGDFVPEIRLTLIPGSAAHVLVRVGYPLGGRLGWGSADALAPAGTLKVVARGRLDGGENHYAETLAAADGTWNLGTLPTGTYTLTFSNARNTSVPSTTRTVVLDRPQLAVDAVVSRGLTISGVLRDEDGEPVSNAGILVVGVRGSAVVSSAAGRATTDADGRFVVGELPTAATIGPVSFVVQVDDAAGRWAPTVYPSARLVTDGERFTFPANATTGNVEIEMTATPAATVFGRVSAGSIAGADAIELQRLDGSGAWARVSRSTLGPDGFYQFGSLFAGSYRLVPSSSSSGWSPRRLEPTTVTLATGDRVELDLSTSPAWVRDTTGDGIPDLLARSSAGVVMRGTGTTSGTLGAPSRVGSGWTGFHQVVLAGDVDLDGLPDAVGVTTAGKLRLMRGLSDGGFAAATSMTSPHVGVSRLVAPGDLTGDGRVDLIVIFSGGRAALLPGESATSWSQYDGSSDGWQIVTAAAGVGDFDGDGGPDLLVRTRDGSIWRCEGIVLSQCARRIATGWNRFDAFVGAGDLSGDGYVDVVARTPEGRLYLYRGTGSGGFRLGSTMVGSGWRGLTLLG